MPDETACQKAERLKALYEALITGEAVTETRFGEDAVRFAKADMEGLKSLIRDAEAACIIEMGGTPKRRRYAMGVRFGRY